jgi:hypothetical protein
MGDTTAINGNPRQDRTSMTEMTTHKRYSRHAAMAPGSQSRPWPLIVIAAPAAVAIWSGWVGLGGMCGFGPVNLLPGIGGGFFVNTAITLPIGIESYGAYALSVWLAGRASERTRLFARRSAIGALVLGCFGQVAYHLLAAAHWAEAPWPVVVCVSCLPVVTLFFAATLMHLKRADARRATETTADAGPEAIAEAMPEAVQMPQEMPSEETAAEPPEVPSEEAVSVPPEVPAQEPSEEPPVRSVRLIKSPEAERGRAEYRKSTRQGQPLSDRALGAKFGKSRTWGANRIREVEEGPALTAQAR